MLKSMTGFGAGTGTMSGPELTINLASNTSVFKGSEGGRVTGVFTPP